MEKIVVSRVAMFCWKCGNCGQWHERTDKGQLDFGAGRDRCDSCLEDVMLILDTD